MHITITFKLAADSKDELINTFGSTSRLYRARAEELAAAGLFGPPDQVELRWLFVGGQWRDLPDVPGEVVVDIEEGSSVPPNLTPNPTPKDT